MTNFKLKRVVTLGRVRLSARPLGSVESLQNEGQIFPPNICAPPVASE